jgi:hypothetical protein
MRQVRDFLIELRWGPASTMWIGICEPSVVSLRRAAQKLEYGELASKLDTFLEVLRAVSTDGATTLESAAREKVLAAYADLAALMPDTFALDMDRSQREAVVLHALLAQVPEVRKITIEKLYAAGLSTLETLLLATAEDIASTTGIPSHVAGGIVERFRLYRDETKSATVDATRTHERVRLAALVGQLRRENEEYERAAAEWTKAAGERKKALRQARTQTMLEIHVLLARLGEIAVVRELERLPFERKLARVEVFLEQARERYAAAAPA